MKIKLPPYVIFLLSALVFLIESFLTGVKMFGIGIGFLLGVAMALTLAFGPTAIAMELYGQGHYWLSLLAAIVAITIWGAGYKHLND